MITQREIAQLAFREGIGDRVIEKDYVITWLLLGLADSKLKKSLAFKGGTALKKTYFPDYRYSEDLDFTLLNGADSQALVSGFDQILKNLARSQGFQFAIPEGRIERRTDSLTVYVNFVGPLRARLESRDLKIDFTLSERLILPTEERAIRSSYSDAVSREIGTYSLEEILVEKLCALIGRTEPRDIYDAHFLFGLEGLDFYRISDAFREKAEFKGIDPSRLADVLDRKRPVLAKMWESRLRHQVKDLPHLEGVLRELNRYMRNLPSVRQNEHVARNNESSFGGPTVFGKRASI